MCSSTSRQWCWVHSNPLWKSSRRSSRGLFACSWICFAQPRSEAAKNNRHASFSLEVVVLPGAAASPPLHGKKRSRLRRGSITVKGDLQTFAETQPAPMQNAGRAGAAASTPLCGKEPLKSSRLRTGPIYIIPLCVLLYRKTLSLPPKKTNAGSAQPQHMESSCSPFSRPHFAMPMWCPSMLS